MALPLWPVEAGLDSDPMFSDQPVKGNSPFCGFVYAALAHS